MACVFDISGDLAMYRKSYTTTSSISYPFPPPTAIAGLIAAILGFDHGSSRGAQRAEYWLKMKGTRIALRINHPVRWFRAGINLINTKSNKYSDHTQIKHQFIKKPSYRVYVDGPLEEALSDSLQSKGHGTGQSRQESTTAMNFHFSPYLGVAYCPANVEWVGTFAIEKAENRSTIDSVLPVQNKIPKLDIRKTGNLNQSLVPFQMDINRKLLHTVNVLYKMEGGAIVLDGSDETFGRYGGLCEVTCVGKDCVAWFAPWE